jgi:lantibiotic biosynthesis protein
MLRASLVPASAPRPRRCRRLAWSPPPPRAILSAVTARGWQPILHDDEAAAARRAASDIAAALARDRQPLGFDLADGAAGLALLFGYRALAEGDPDDRARASALLAQAGEHLAAAPTTTSLFHGFPGVAWATDHIGALFGEREPDAGDDIDDAILARLAAEPDPGFDLVTGAVGLGVHALERRGHPPADRCADRVVAHLAATARRAPGGLVWWTAPGAPEEVDLGLAHGVPGVIALLARCIGLAGSGDTARELLEGAVRWLLRHRRDGDSAFPSRLALDPGGRERDPASAPPARSGWCYGDAAVALAILRASEVGERAWLDAALAIAHRAARRPLTDTRVRDATLCHGAAALGLVYQRLHHATGDAVMRTAARDWVLRIFDYRDERANQLSSSAGFFQATRDEPIADRGLMNGAAGVGLVLLAACSHVAPDWDRALLL